MGKLNFSHDELMAEHAFATKIRHKDKTLHGGLLTDGTYRPPRSLNRIPAIDAWWQRLRDEGRAVEVMDRAAIDRANEFFPSVGRRSSCCSTVARAMEMAGISAKDLDLIVMATMTPDTACPAGSNWLEAKLGAEKAVSFDVTAACSGFIFGLSVAEQYLKAGTFKTALVVAVEIMSRTLDWTDRESCILWGDGAGAAVLQGFDSPGKNQLLHPKGKEVSEVLSVHIHTDGANGQNLLLPGGGSKKFHSD